jgi:beta-lactamase regulating signal transducer with metallopeptidase domain
MAIVSELLLMFLKAQAMASCAILLVLALRLPVRRLFGAEIGYSLWSLVPAAGVAGLFPSLPEVSAELRLSSPPHGVINTLAALRAPALQHSDLIWLGWLAGAMALGGFFVFGQWRFEQSARAGLAGPAAAGFWPRMIVPAGYASRFTLEERELIRAHERIHMERRDPTANLLIAFLQAVSWFNPLAHLAATLARMDQELSVDATVMAAHPRGRRRYAETLLKAHAHGLNSPLACALALGGRHPLEVRLAMLGMGRVSVQRDGLGMLLVGILVVFVVSAVLILAPGLKG